MVVDGEQGRSLQERVFLGKSDGSFLTFRTSE